MLTRTEDRPNSSWAICFRRLNGVQFDIDFPSMHAMIHWLHGEQLECTVNFVQENTLIEKVNPQAYVPWSRQANVLGVGGNPGTRIRRLDRSDRSHQLSRGNFRDSVLARLHKGFMVANYPDDEDVVDDRARDALLLARSSTNPISRC